MKNRVLTVAFLVVLGTMTTSCQKENFANVTSESSISEGNTVYTVQYVVNGVRHTKSLPNEAEYMAFVKHLIELSYLGYEVEIANDYCSSTAIPTKEVITYTTESEENATKWTLQKMEEGYKVRITFDQTNNVYVCIAYKK